MRFFDFVMHTIEPDRPSHTYPYHQSVAQAVHAAGLPFQGLTPRETAFQSEIWTPKLNVKEWHPDISLQDKLITTYQRVGALQKAFKECGTKPKILFFEGISIYETLSLMLALLSRGKKQDHLLLLLRCDFRGHLKNQLITLIHKLLKVRTCVTFLTDSEVVAEKYAPLFKAPIHVLPIPHTQQGHSGVPQEKLTLWWPGSPRAEKGIETIRSLIQKKHPLKEGWQLWVSENADLPMPKPFVQPLPVHLTQDEYYGRLYSTDLLILPYPAEFYWARTSGIFVEGIFAEKITLVSDGTWSANELKKHDLQELILDWKRDDLFETIDFLSKCSQVKKKLAAMSQYYKGYHSQENYNREFAKHLQIGCS